MQFSKKDVSLCQQFNEMITKSITCMRFSAVSFAIIMVLLTPVFSTYGLDESLPPYTIGPGGGGALYHPAFNPHDPDNFFITCDMGSSFVTHDGGKSFKSLLLGRSVSYAGMPRWWFTPHSENTVYATVGTVVYVSHDKGRTWDFMFPSKDDYVGLAHLSASSGVGNVQPHFKTGTLQANYCLISFYAHPADKNILYALSAGKSYGGWGRPNYPIYESVATVYRSVNGGKTWEVFKEINGLQHWEYVNGTGFALWVNQLQGNSAQMTLFQNELRIVTHQGLFRIDATTGELLSERRMDTERYYGAVGFGGNMHMVVDDNRMKVYMVAWEGNDNTAKYENQVLKSNDFGETWHPVTANFIETARTLQGRTFQQHLYDTWYDWFYPEMRVTFMYMAVAGKRLYVGFNGNDWRVNGLAMTEDDGESWTLVYLGLRKGQREGFGGYNNQYTGVSPIDDKQGDTSFSGTGGKGLTVNPNNPDQVILTNMVDAFMTMNGGETWCNLASRRTDGGSVPVPAAGETPFWTTTGIEPAGQSVLAINPYNLNHHLSGWTDIGMFESFDGGNSWTHRVVNGLPAGNCHAIAFDPHNDDVILAAFTSRQSAVLADIVSVNSPDAARAGGMARSTDGGNTWAISYLGEPTTNLLSDPNNAGLPVRAIINDIIFDPVNNAIVYALCSGAGVYKSVNGGVTWVYFNNGVTLQSHTVNSVTRQGIFGRIRLSEDGNTLFLTNDGIAYRLDIAGQASVWMPLNSPDNASINRIEADGDNVLYATTALQQLSGNAIPFNGGLRADVGLGGAWVSPNGGQTWRQLFDETYQVTDIKSDSRNRNILLLTTRAGKVYTSNKGASTSPEDWTEVEGLAFHHPSHIFEDPQDPRRFYVTTNCGGTWSMPLSERQLETGICPGIIPGKSLLNVYPNPVGTGQTLYIETNRHDRLPINAVIDVYNLSGQRIGTYPVQGPSTAINIEYTAGIYVFVLKYNDEISKSIKIIVR